MGALDDRFKPEEHTTTGYLDEDVLKPDRAVPRID
jgi:hypothetical protein